MKYFIVAGEKSGDLHAGNLAKALLGQSPELKLYGWGGERMKKSGVEILQDYEELAIMGFIEVLKNLSKIRGFMRLIKEQITILQPDALILVDYAGFNLRLAKWAKAKGLKVFYYIAPKAWAWNKSRAYKLQKYTDLTLVIFPFEVAFFEKYGVNVKYVGNPLFDEIRGFTPDTNTIEELQKDGKPIIALLPGSRKQEIENMLTVMEELASRFPKYKWVVAGISTIPDHYYTGGDSRFEIVKDATYDLLSVASAAVVTSGTATLETALFGVPQVVVYKTSKITYTIARLLIEIKYISLVNLVAEKEVVKELIQGEYTTNNTFEELENILNNNNLRELQLLEYKNIIDKLGKNEASKEAASQILNFQSK